MKLLFTDVGWNDYQHWLEFDKDIRKRINELLRDARRSPFSGIGKPAPLSGNLKGWWSRRITRERRMIYRVSGQNETQVLEISACRFHYK